jgi:CelD/BcsL family acetyltransferase involved in cellulose biosynthesis
VARSVGSQPASTCLELPVRPASELVESLGSRHRKRNRRMLRRIDDLELRTDPVPSEPGPIAHAVVELLDLHARQWAGRPINPAHVSGRFRRHLTAAAQRMVPAGQAALLRTTLDGTVVAVSMSMLTDDLVGAYLYGVDPDLRAQVDVQALMVRQRLDVGLARGAHRPSLLRGDEESKRRWEPAERPNQQIVLLRPLSAPAVVTAAAMLVRGAAEDRIRRSPGATRAVLRLRERWHSIAAGSPAGPRPGGTG